MINVSKICGRFQGHSLVAGAKLSDFKSKCWVGISRLWIVNSLVGSISVAFLAVVWVVVAPHPGVIEHCIQDLIPLRRPPEGVIR